ncbi:Fe-S cluster assembly protein SufB [Fervidicoccus fontis]|nr:Fe-S cluster assembly protein SufB [Fervidicoccus fontis]PMB75429.1 MAG: Fe-S cluster assembly protein SufB [Fervidicoccus fontis]PMB76705.1 MAG: Fe-S cluster assembly protein SufB [Fervidicoccus fontis]HEW63714.1 Fe-S cluster assembly protein SufB [Fervidicoccus fontis]
MLTEQRGLENNSVKYSFQIKGELEESIIEEISQLKNEPEWMLRLRKKAFEWYKKLPTPNWLLGVEELTIDELTHYLKPDVNLAKSWEELPENIRKMYEVLNIPEVEARALSGLSLHLESDTIYLKTKKALEEKGVIMIPMEEAVKKYPDIVKSYFSKVFPFTEHKFIALHYALWSSGVFVYVPKNVKIRQPIEAFFVISQALEGQYEHTLIVLDENSYIEFIEGCSAPMYKTYSFHDGAVEIYAHKNSHIKFTTLQNWSENVINFNNKRAIAEEGAEVDWLEGSVGSKVTYVYPSTILKGDNSKTTIYTITLSKGNKIKDAGAKVIMNGKNTAAKIVNKSISADGGINIYRGLIRINKGAINSRATSSCESLILDEKSKAYTYPHNQVLEDTAFVNHEAKTGKINEDQLFYLESRGLRENEAKSIIVLGYLENVLVNLPFEMASVLNSVIQLEFSSIGGKG